MNNKYKIIGDYVEIYLWKATTNNFLTTLIDLEDLKKMDNFDLTWTARWRKDVQSYYV
jgi:hypothetical protein